MTPKNRLDFYESKPRLVDGWPPFGENRVRSSSAPRRRIRRSPRSHRLATRFQEDVELSVHLLGGPVALMAAGAIFVCLGVASVVVGILVTLEIASPPSFGTVAIVVGLATLVGGLLTGYSGVVAAAMASVEEDAYQ